MADLKAQDWRRTSAPDAACLCGKAMTRGSHAFLHASGVFACSRSCTQLTEPQPARDLPAAPPADLMPEIFAPAELPIAEDPPEAMDLELEQPDSELEWRHRSRAPMQFVCSCGKEVLAKRSCSLRADGFMA